MIKDRSTYTRFDTLRDIIEDDSQVLDVINRFDISFGFGDGTVEKVCMENGVDTDTFLAVVNYITGKHWESYPVSPLSLIGYLRRSHAVFIDYMLPYIKRTLLEGIHQTDNPEIAIVILQFYDKYIEEVKAHMGYEDDFIFSYVECLINGGNEVDRFKISDFSSSHDHVAAKLDDLKELLIYKYRHKNNGMINSALLHLILCGKDLIKHCEIENHLLFPQVERLEREIRKKQIEADGDESGSDTSKAEVLTDREKEVLRWIAFGLSTKEIAEKMFLSVHTVNSYRKNIGAKLNIHSVSGMAFYAVLHHIIDINEIEIQ